jgi:hypothetical protein
MIGDAFGIIRPFQAAFVSFLLASTYVAVALPYLPPESMNDGKKPAKGGISGFLAPLRVLAPQTLRLRNGQTRKHYGVLFLCCGVFLGVVCYQPLNWLAGYRFTDPLSQLATGYAPLLIQMYATAVFDFNQADNGWLMSEFAFMRSIFLIFIFPRVISWGRKWYLARGERDDSKDESDEAAELPTEPQAFGAGVINQAENEPVPREPLQEHENTAFDLFFLRWSLVVDGGLTTLAAFATQGWHIYLCTPMPLSPSSREANAILTVPQPRTCFPLVRGRHRLPRESSPSCAHNHNAPMLSTPLL